MTQNIIEALREGNKWWERRFELDFKPREIYEEIKKFLDTQQIIALTGLRRVGKTTILLKIATEYLNKLDNTNILYFSFDDFSNVKIKEIIDVYARIMNKDFNRENYLFLFDEIQKLKNWEEQIKRIYDAFKNIKIVISGSESLFIKKISRESLAGRMFEFQVNPLNFREYLDFKGKNIKNLELNKEEILKEFNNYLLCSGFPEIINQNQDIIKKYIKEIVIEKIIYKDIPLIFPVKEPAIMESLFRTILFNPGEIINIDNLADNLKVSRQTISVYLNFLEKSFLIKKIYNFSRNVRKTNRKLKKYYPTILLPEIVNKPELFGKVFETSLILNLNAEYFWRDTYKNEIDIVILINDQILPIEIKLSKIDCKALNIFMRKFRINKGIILTYEKNEVLNFKEKEITVIPFYEYIIDKKNA